MAAEEERKGQGICRLCASNAKPSRSRTCVGKDGRRSGKRGGDGGGRGGKGARDLPLLCVERRAVLFKSAGGGKTGESCSCKSH
eukprot:359071-Chlamydomonas_euryale.AAC.12